MSNNPEIVRPQEASLLAMYNVWLEVPGVWRGDRNLQGRDKGNRR